MMKTVLYKKSGLLASFFFAAILCFAQDPTFSQFDANQMYYNPAYAGYKKEGRVDATYRTLWPNVPGQPFPGPLSTYSVFGDAYFNIQNRFIGGAGAFVMQDMEGEGLLTTTSAGIMYAQHLPSIRARNDDRRQPAKFDLYAGFKVYYNHIHIDWNRFVFSDQLNPNYGITGPSSFNQEGISQRDYFDFDWGMLVRNNFRARGKWISELGFAMAHVLSPSIAITGSNADDAHLPRKYVATYRANVAITENKLYIGPTILFENQKKFFETTAGLDFYFKMGKKYETVPLSIGIYNRFSEIIKNQETGQTKINTSAVILAVTHKGNFPNMHNPVGYSVGFSVDFPYMGLGMQNAGAYEVTMGVLIPYKHPDVMKCFFEY
jgi:type IX secretion system PorP/SprF family membrane protein